MGTATKVIDVARFKPVVDQALAAFAADLGYTEAMVTAARGVRHKRFVWSLRIEVREQTACAQAKCAKRSFTCDAASPCGFGDCYFRGPLQLPVVAPLDKKGEPGKGRRPQESTYPHYDLEAVVYAAVELSKAV